MIYSNKEFDINLETVKDGIRVRQHNRIYLAKKWKLNDDVRLVLNTAINFGLTSLWQEGHPRKNESHHLSFSFTHKRNSWIFVIGKEACPPKIKTITFNKNLKKYFEDFSGKISWTMQPSGGKNIFIELNELEATLTLLPLKKLKDEIK